MNSEILHGDCLEVLKKFPDNHFDSCVTDPPYGLEFMGKTWDGADGFRRSLNAADTGRDNVFGRTSKTSPEYRVTGAVPQSGKRPVSDQPGSHDEGYRNMKGKEPLFQQWCELWAAEVLRVLKPGGHLLAFGGTRTYHRMACAIEDAGFEIRDSLHWIYASGFPKGKACLKPAHEPVVMARKPDKHSIPLPGLDECRVPGIPPSVPQPSFNSPTGSIYEMKTGEGRNGEMSQSTLGRWPPNILLSGDVAAEMDRQSGQLTSGVGAVKRATGKGYHPDILGAESRPEGAEMICYGDTGGASRFFPVFKYQAKAPQKERPKVDGISHPTCKPLELMRWLVRLVTPPEGICLDPFAGTGTTGQACRLEGFSYVLIEREEDYIKLISARMYQEPTLFDDW